MPSNHSHFSRWIALFRSFGGAALVTASFALGGCGSTAAAGANTETDAMTESSAHASDSSANAGDAETSQEAGAAQGPDAASGGGDGGSCSGSKGKACETCCKMAFPQGSKALLETTLMCICENPDVCGAGAGDGGSSPVDAAGGDAHASGGGVCQGSCGGSKTTPDSACLTCIAAVVVDKQGTCFQNDQTACMANAQCAQYVSCITSCGQ